MCGPVSCVVATDSTPNAGRTSHKCLVPFDHYRDQAREYAQTGINYFHFKLKPNVFFSKKIAHFFICKMKIKMVPLHKVSMWHSWTSTRTGPSDLLWTFLELVHFTVILELLTCVVHTNLRWSAHYFFFPPVVLNAGYLFGITYGAPTRNRIQVPTMKLS